MFIDPPNTIDDTPEDREKVISSIISFPVSLYSDEPDIINDFDWENNICVCKNIRHISNRYCMGFFILMIFIYYNLFAEKLLPLSKLTGVAKYANLVEVRNKEHHNELCNSANTKQILLAQS